jgi:hypothetical protein
MWSPILTTLLLLSVHHVEAQAINPDLVVWTTISQWQDLRTCVQGALVGEGLGDNFRSIQELVGCTTNACLCRADTLGSAEQIISSEASTLCSDVQDISTATSILSSYCSAKGYTSIIQPTILASTTAGAYTYVPTPTATVTAYVTQYVTVSGATCKNSQLQAAKIGVAVLLVLLMHHSGIF